MALHRLLRGDIAEAGKWLGWARNQIVNRKRVMGTAGFPYHLKPRAGVDVRLHSIGHEDWIRIEAAIGNILSLGYADSDTYQLRAAGTVRKSFFPGVSTAGGTIFLDKLIRMDGARAVWMVQFLTPGEGASTRTFQVFTGAARSLYSQAEYIGEVESALRMSLENLYYPRPTGQGRIITMQGFYGDESSAGVPIGQQPGVDLNIFDARPLSLDVATETFTPLSLPAKAISAAQYTRQVSLPLYMGNNTLFCYCFETDGDPPDITLSEWDFYGLRSTDYGASWTRIEIPVIKSGYFDQLDLIPGSDGDNILKRNAMATSRAYSLDQNNICIVMKLFGYSGGVVDLGWVTYISNDNGLTFSDGATFLASPGEQSLQQPFAPILSNIAPNAALALVRKSDDSVVFRRSLNGGSSWADWAAFPGPARTEFKQYEYVPSLTQPHTGSADVAPLMMPWLETDDRIYLNLSGDGGQTWARGGLLTPPPPILFDDPNYVKAVALDYEPADPVWPARTAEAA